MFFASYRLRRIRKNACDRVSSIAVTTGIRYSFTTRKECDEGWLRFTALFGALSIALLRWSATSTSAQLART
jgi:hypothetical protein